MEKVLELKEVVKVFPGVRALDGVNLSVYKGRAMALLGENGAGKSTLMKVMTGIYKPDGGGVYLNGELQHFNGPKDSQEKGLAIIHQELNLIAQMSIGENIFLGHEHTLATGAIDWKTLHHEADMLLQKLNLPYSSKTLVGKLSVGQQQLVEIAKALSQNAKTIVFDEPTDALTESETESLFTVIKELTDSGKSVVYITHRLPEVFEICHDVTILRDGKFILEKEVAELTEDEIIENMVGRKLTEQFPRIDIEKGPQVLEVKNLKNSVVDNVSFSLHAGEILGIAGLMGAGRTELAQTIYGALPKEGGEIAVDGVSVSIRSPQDGLKSGIAYVSEDRKKDGLVLGLGVRENMSLSSLTAFQEGRLSLDKEAEESKVDRYVKSFNIKTPSIDQLIKNLSGGNQQKVAIAKALMTNPKVLILDEPTRGVDVGAKKEIYDLINTLKAEGLSIIMISSEMPEILGMSDRIMVMYNHKITGAFSIEEATQERIMKCAIGVKEQDYE